MSTQRKHACVRVLYVIGRPRRLTARVDSSAPRIGLAYYDCSLDLISPCYAPRAHHSSTHGRTSDMSLSHTTHALPPRVVLVANTTASHVTYITIHVYNNK